MNNTNCPSNENCPGSASCTAAQILKRNTKYEDYLEENIVTLQDELSFQTSLLNSFWTGDIPDNASLNHMILAKAGRHRLQEKAKVCALLEQPS